MQVSVKHTVPECVSQKIINEIRAKGPVIKALNYVKTLSGLSLAQVCGDRRSCQEFRGKDTGSCTAPIHPRNLLKDVVTRISAEFLHVMAFTPKVEFFLTPRYELFEGSNNPVERPNPQQLNHSHHCLHNREIGAK